VELLCLNLVSLKYNTVSKLSQKNLYKSYESYFFMMNGGDISRNLLQNSFSRVKADIERLNTEILLLKKEQKNLIKENLELKTKLNNNGLDKEIIKEIVRETLKNVQTKNRTNDTLIKKFNKKRRVITLNKIQALASDNRLSLSEIREIIVENENLCSKATFYRYVDKLKKKGSINVMNIDNNDIVVKI